ncbi:tRNA-dihydrouridine(47) synthase [Alternaria alternata]|nr:tRNA-dihydrouridine(47) synthase [Alternaria alternata]
MAADESTLPAEVTEPFDGIDRTLTVESGWWCSVLCLDGRNTLDSLDRSVSILNVLAIGPVPLLWARRWFGFHIHGTVASIHAISGGTVRGGLGGRNLPGLFTCRHFMQASRPGLQYACVVGVAAQKRKALAQIVRANAARRG